jgi:hypothetical protein
MAVPTIGNFLMFGTGSNTTIAGAIIEGGVSSETVASTLNFNALKALADINKFDTEFKENATTLEQIVKSSQFRGYPITGTTTTTTTTTLAPTLIITNFFATGSDPSLAALTCASTSSYTIQLFGDPGNDSPVFCGSDEILSVDITNLLNDGQSIPVGSTFYLSSEGQVRTWVRPFESNIAFRTLDSCSACPTTTTTEPPIMVAAVNLLSGGTDCNNSPDEIVANTVYLAVDFGEFFEDTDGKLRLDNSPTFASPSTTIYNPNLPGVEIDSRSVEGTAIITEGSFGETLLVHQTSMVNTIGTKLLAYFDSTSTITINTCP